MLALNPRKKKGDLSWITLADYEELKNAWRGMEERGYANIGSLGMWGKPAWEAKTRAWAKRMQYYGLLEDVSSTPGQGSLWRLTPKGRSVLLLGGKSKEYDPDESLATTSKVPYYPREDTYDVGMQKYPQLSQDFREKWELNIPGFRLNKAYTAMDWSRHPGMNNPANFNFKKEFIDNYLKNELRKLNRLSDEYEELHWSDKRLPEVQERYQQAHDDLQDDIKKYVEKFGHHPEVSYDMQGFHSEGDSRETAFLKKYEDTLRLIEGRPLDPHRAEDIDSNDYNEGADQVRAFQLKMLIERMKKGEHFDNPAKSKIVLVGILSIFAIKLFCHA